MKALMNYVADERGDGIVPFLLDNQWSGATPVPIEVDIDDARPFANTLSLSKQGFVIDRLISGVTDYRDEEQLSRLFAPAVTDRIVRLTGAKWALTFAHNVRFSDRSPLSTSTPVAAPARIVHSDLGPLFNPANIDENPLSKDAAAEMERRLGKGRAPKKWCVYNVWQQISPPPQDKPLALCDLRTVSGEDILNGHGRDGTPDSRIYGLTFFQHNPAHRWYYFSDMLPGEVLIFSAYDPEAGPVNARVPHNAFELSNDPDHAIPRNSIEIRALAVFEE